MTFLKRLGQILLQVAGVATGIFPLIQPLLGSGKAATITGAAVNDFTQISAVIVQLETAFAAVPNSTGAQKLQAAIPLVANIIKTSEVVSGKKIANEALFTQGVTEVAQGVVDILNSIDAGEAKHA